MPRSFNLHTLMLAGCGLLPVLAWGQGAAVAGLPPTPDQVSRAASFSPPKLGDYAKRLAEQPDFMGSWGYTSPPSAAGATVFDAANMFVPPLVLLPGEQRFGPPGGTYNKSIPYKPEYQKIYMDLVQDAANGRSKDTFALCIPYGMPRVMGGAAGAMDIIQSPDVVLLHNSYSTDMRRIFLDGRPHPGPDGPDGTDGRTLTGHSVGRFEGNTLVVHTTNIMAGNYDATTPPYSEQISIVERIRLIDHNTLEDEMTITDPVMLTRPWVVTRYFQRLGGAGSTNGPVALAPLTGDRIVHAFHNMADRPCVPNVEMEDGYQKMVLPQEIEAQQAGEKQR